MDREGVKESRSLLLLERNELRGSKVLPRLRVSTTEAPFRIHTWYESLEQFKPSSSESCPEASDPGEYKGP